MAPRGGRREHVLDADISFDMQRLFDPYNFDHIPYDDRLALFKQRDLPHIKHYKAAVKIFGGPHVRTRAIVAPPMETPLKHRLGHYFNVKEFPSPPTLNGPLKPPVESAKVPSKEEKDKIDEDEKLLNYKSWINSRKQLRGNLDGLGLTEALLSRKTDKSELEKRVEAKFRHDRLWKPETPPPPEEKPPPKPLPDVPTMTVPPPDGIQILDKFLSQNRMRLMDLFQIADKDKSWSLSREELMKAIAQSDIPLTEGEVDDMILTLDADMDDELSYKEMNQGLTMWKKQRRDIKRQGGEVASTGTSTAGRQSKKPGTSQSQVKSNTKTPSQETKSLSRENTKDRLSQGAETTVSEGPQRQMSMEKMSRESLKKSTSQERLSREPTMETTFSEGPRRQSSKERISRESSKKPGSQEGLARENTQSGKGSSLAFSLYKEKSNVSISKTSSHGGKRLQIIDSDTEGGSVTLPPSQGNQSSGQNFASQEGANQDHSQMERSVFEDTLFQSEDSPRAFTAQELGERQTAKGNEKTERTKLMSDNESGARPSSRKGGSAASTRSRSSTPNTLEPPEFDLRDEARAPESVEALLDTRKHDRVVLSRNTIKRSLSRQQKVLFDEIPGVIKVGYRPIDDHCSESTLTGEVASMMNQFRREKLKEYFEVKKMCEETGMPLTQKTLDRVLLYPGDRPFNHMKKTIATPLGPLTNEQSPFNQPKPKKKNKKKRRGMGRISRTSGISGASLGGGRASGAGGAVTPRGNASSLGAAPEADDRLSSAGSKRSFITVEDVYPFASTVAPKVYKENLSSGRALITRKVDNWMTFEEYNKYTENLPNRFRHLNRRSNPDAFWPGYVLDKMRLCLAPEDGGPAYHDAYGQPILNRDSRAYEGLGVGAYNGRGHAVFRVKTQTKRAYPGYNNDLLTWPVGENGVRYANIDEHRIVR